MKRAAIILPVLLAACTGVPTEWVRTETGAVQREKDYQECRHIAWKQALDESSSSRPLYPPWTGTGFDMRSPSAPGYRHESPSYFARGPREAEFTSYCMGERGYRLQPVAKPG
jgi:hypothetical protein